MTNARRRLLRASRDQRAHDPPDRRLGVRVIGLKAERPLGRLEARQLVREVVHDAARVTWDTEAAPGSWVHALTLDPADDFDAELAAWIRRSYRLMKLQQRLRRKAR